MLVKGETPSSTSKFKECFVCLEFFEDPYWNPPTTTGVCLPTHQNLSKPLQTQCLVLWILLERHQMLWKRKKSSKSTQNHLIQSPRCPFRPPRRHVVCSGSRSVSPWHTSVCPESNYSIENSRNYHSRNEKPERKKTLVSPK